MSHDDSGFWIFVAVLILLALAFVWGMAFGADGAAATHCITLGFDHGEWIDDVIKCETFKVIGG